MKTTCKLDWPSVRYRKTWTYSFLVVGLFVPLVAIAIFNVLLVYRMRVLNRNKQKAGVQRMRRLTDVARMVLAVVVIFAVCQLPYHVMEIISVQVDFQRPRIFTARRRDADVGKRYVCLSITRWYCAKTTEPNS